MSIEALLHEEIEKEFDELSRMEAGSEKYKATVDGLVKLVDRAIEMNKYENEFQDRTDGRKAEDEFKKKQFEDEKRDRLIKNIIAVATIAVPSAITIWGTLTSLEFEKTDTVTTIMGRGFINKLLPKK